MFPLLFDPGTAASRNSPYISPAHNIMLPGEATSGERNFCLANNHTGFLFCEFFIVFCFVLSFFKGETL